jgi:hypothetical protein
VPEATASASQSDAERFRNIFSSLLPAELRPVQDRLIYFPTPAFCEPARAGTPDGFLDELAARARQQSPDALYTAGDRHSVAPVSQECLQAELCAYPMTFVVVPGIFGEFIESRVFEEVFSRDSAFGTEWKHATDRAHRTALSQDPSFRLRELREVDAPLYDLVSAASLEDTHGKTLVRLLHTNAPFMSLESMRGSDEIAAILVRRLDKVFALTPVPEHIVLLGYSKGACVVFSLAEQAQSRPWGKRVKACVTLGGTVYGSDLADSVDDPSSVTGQRVRAAKKLYESLAVPAEGSESCSASIVAANTAACLAFLSDITQTAGLPNTEELKHDARVLDPVSLAQVTIRVAHAFGLDKPVAEYRNNVRRFKEFLRIALIGVDELTTRSRLAWWRTHDLPASVRYYCLTASMNDPQTSSLSQQIAASPYAYHLNSPDYRFLLNSYRELRDSQGFRVNDSQMTVQKARLWPDLNKLLNPSQPPLQAHFLGVLATDHWGMALRAVSKMRDGSVNPFPRTTLLQAIAVTIARDASPPSAKELGQRD